MQIYKFPDCETLKAMLEGNLFCGHPKRELYESNNSVKVLAHLIAQKFQNKSMSQDGVEYCMSFVRIDLRKTEKALKEQKGRVQHLKLVSGLLADRYTPVAIKAVMQTATISEKDQEKALQRMAHQPKYLQLRDCVVPSFTHLK